MTTTTSNRPLSVVVSTRRNNGKPGWSVRSWTKDQFGKVLGTVDWSDLNINTNADAQEAFDAARAMLPKDRGVFLVPFRDGWATQDVVDAYR